MIFVTGISVTFLHASVSVACIAELGFFRHSIYSSKASGQFGAGLAMMCYALAALAVSRAIMGAGTIYVVMWTGHKLFFILLFNMFVHTDADFGTSPSVQMS
jgi:hypothetical protein